MTALRSLTLDDSSSADLRSEKTTDQAAVSCSSTSTTSPDASPISKPAKRSPMKFGDVTDLSKPWRISISAYTVRVQWNDSLRVTCESIEGDVVHGLLVEFRGLDVTDRLEPIEREAMRLCLVENFHRGEGL